MIKFDEARIACAKAIYDLLSTSKSQQWFSVAAISQKAGLELGGGFVGRILTISEEEDGVFVSDLNGNWTLDKVGFDLVEAQSAFRTEESGDFAPAADRVVRFNHNAPDAEAIDAQLEEVSEAVRGANGPEIDEQERQRVFDAMLVAKAIWRSGNFKLIQLKVGVLMAVEDAARLLSKTAKHVAAALLVDAIKAFVKSHFQTDLDAF